MKIKRFNAPDMRQALRLVREALGPDAVILSNRKCEEGVELVAAVDYDESAFVADTQLEASVSAPAPARHTAEPVRAENPSLPSPEEQVRAQLAQMQRQTAAAARSAEQRKEPAWASKSRPVVDEEPTPKVAAPAKPVTTPPTAAVSERENLVLLEMRREMESMRRMVQNEFSVMGWGEMGRRNPIMQDLFRRLMGLELSADLCHGLVKKVEKVEDPEQAWRKALAILAASLPVYGRDVMEEGGVIAFVGPTGVGKTTTIAKLAARYCLRHGNRHVGLITADSYRVGGHDQIGVYARLLDVPLRSVSNTRELEAALNAMIDKRLVLIDTAGMSQRDPRLKEQLAFLSSERKSIRRFLTLASTTQQSALEQAMLGFGDASPEACILTKVDEAASLGGAFSALIRHGLPLAFITDGQKVPEDMHLPRSQALVNRAVNMSQQYAIAQSEQYLALAFGGSGADARI